MVDTDIVSKAPVRLLISGIGFESGGLAGAYAIHNGFTAIPETHKMYHGEKVTFGTLVQLVLEDLYAAIMGTYALGRYYTE